MADTAAHLVDRVLPCLSPDALTEGNPLAKETDHRLRQATSRPKGTPDRRYSKNKCSRVKEECT
jgi:hypothetical protein